MKDIKQIEEKAKEYTTNSVGKSNEFTKAWHKVYGGVMYGVELATQWNSPEEKPEENLEEILFCRDGVIYIGFYDVLWKRWVSHSGSDFITIDGWQYLPSIK